MTLRPLLKEKKTDPEGIQSLHSAAGSRLRELEALLLQPLLFGSERTFSAVHDLSESLVDFLELVSADAPKAASHWRAGLASALKAVLATVFDEVDRLVRDEQV